MAEQERDDHGRFSGGGGNTGSRIPALEHAAQGAENKSASARMASKTTEKKGTASAHLRAASKHEAATSEYIGSRHPQAGEKIREHKAAASEHRAKARAISPVGAWASSKD